MERGSNDEKLSDYIFSLNNHFYYFAELETGMADNQFMAESPSNINPEEQDKALLVLVHQNQGLQSIENANQNGPNQQFVQPKLELHEPNNRLLLKQNDETLPLGNLHKNDVQKVNSQMTERVQHNFRAELAEQLKQEKQFSKQQEDRQKSGIINMSVPQLPIENQQFQKKQENEKLTPETPFMWGQDEQNDLQNGKSNRSFSQFFINSNLAKSQQMFDHFKSNEEKSEQLKDHRKINRAQKQLDSSDDIWRDLRKSMLQKQSRLSIELKKSQRDQNKRVKKDNKMMNFEDARLQGVSQKAVKNNMIKIGRSQNNSQVVNNIENMNKAIMQKVKKWKKEQRQIQQRRNNNINISIQKIKAEQLKQQEQSAKKKLLEKKLRVKAITQRKQNKNKLQLSQTSPDNHKKEKVKIKKSKTEKNDQKPSIQKSEPKMKKRAEDFSIFWNMKDHHELEDKQKLMRRKIFQEKLKEVPVNVNQTKKLKVMIQIDKSANPLKYHFLKKKGLDDQDIYRNHKDFKISENSKKIGIKYLQDLREKNKLDDLKRYMSHQSILNIKKYERNWKSPILQAPHVNEKTSFKVWKDEQKNRRLYDQDNNYLMALKK